MGAGENRQRCPVILWAGCPQGLGAGCWAGSSRRVTKPSLHVINVCWSQGGGDGQTDGSGQATAIGALHREVTGEQPQVWLGVPADSPQQPAVARRCPPSCSLPVSVLLGSAAEIWEEIWACVLLQGQVLLSTALLWGAGLRGPGAARAPWHDRFAFGLVSVKGTMTFVFSCCSAADPAPCGSDVVNCFWPELVFQVSRALACSGAQPGAAMAPR